jgi:hypothetical protein
VRPIDLLERYSSPPEQPRTVAAYVFLEIDTGLITILLAGASMPPKSGSP